MRKDLKNKDQLVFEPVLIIGNCALPIEYQPVWDPQLVQRRLKKFGQFVGFKLPTEPGYRKVSSIVRSAKHLKIQLLLSFLNWRRQNPIWILSL